MTLTNSQKCRLTLSRASQPRARTTRKRTRVTNLSNKMRNLTVRPDRKVFQPNMRNVVATVPRGPTITPDGSKFMKCALHPLMANSMKSNGVPDRYSCDTVVVDHKMTVTVSRPDSNGEISMVILPTLPGALYFKVATGVFPSLSYTQFDGNTGTLTANPGGTCYYGIPFQEYVPSTPFTGVSTGNVLTSMNPYNAARARCVALAVEIKNKGSPNNTTGDIIVTRFPLRVGAQAVIGPVAEPGGGANGKYWQRTVDPPILSQAQANAYKSYVALDAIGGAYSVATRTSPDWDMRDFAPFNSQGGSPPNGSWSGQWWDTVAGDFSGLAGGASALIYGYQPNNPSNNDTVGWSWVDDGTSGIAVQMSGLAVGTAQPTEVTVIMCVEYEVQTSSVVSKFIAPSPPEDPVALKLVSDVMSKLPAAVPAAQNHNGNFWSNLTSMVAGATRGVAKMGFPVVSELAGGASSILSAFGIA